MLAHFDVALLDLFGLFPFLSRRLIGLPPQGTQVDFSALGSVLALLQVVLYQVLSLEYQVLAFPVLDHSHVLQGADDVVRVDAHLFAEGFDGDLLFRVVADVLQQDVFPVCAVGDQP